MPSNIQQNRGVARRRPIQPRAQAKIDLIFEAAVRIIDKEGIESFTTNRIAEVAGISVGTLYQYFSNKEEILDALGRREVDATVQKIMAAVQAGAAPASDRRRQVVHILLGAFGGRHRVRKVLLERALASRGRRAAEGPALLVARFLSSSDSRITLSPTAAFVLTQAVVGVIRAAVMHDERLLSAPEFEDHLVGLIGGFSDYIAARQSA